MLFIKHYRFLFCGLIGLFLAGCSSTNQLYYESFRLAFLADENYFPLEDVRERSYDMIRLEYGDYKPVYLALNFIENGQDKWVTADNVLFVTDGDKVIRTVGLDNDLEFVSDIENNPLRAINDSVPGEWDYTIDIAQQAYDLPLRSTWQIQPQEQLTFFDQTFDVIPVTETINAVKSAPYWTQSKDWTNTYWLDAKTRQVIYTEQLVSPYSKMMKITFVTRIARLIDAGESQQ